MILFPNAKINLGLNILRKRPDGYHDIDTVMYPVPWCDILEIVPSRGEDTTLTVTGRGVACHPEKNLVMKAYRAIADRMPIPPVDIYLHKVIPDGAGLGGGSADASFTIRGLNELFALGMNDEDMAAIAATIGADCPFFIYNRPMRATGIGTEFADTDIDLSGHYIAIVKPTESVPTARAYAGVSPALPDESIDRILTWDISRWQGHLGNDFETSVFDSYPTIKGIKERLSTLGATYASMSGSGSAVFGIFCNDILAETLKREFPDCDIFTGRL